MSNKLFDKIDSNNFVEFEKAIKADLDARVSNSPDIQKAKSDYEKLEDMKASFAKINTSYGSQDSNQEE